MKIRARKERSIPMKRLLALLLMLALTLGACILPATAANEDVTLKFLISSSFFDLNSDIGWEVCQRVAGYKIDFEVLNGTEQLMLIIASGEPYDYVYLNATNYNLMMTEGALMDITDLLAEQGPNILEAITTLWPSTTVDDRIYAIPATVAQPDSLNTSLIARKDLLDAIGYEVLPDTLDGFTKMLEDLKAAYPDMVPMTATQTWLVANIASAFGITGQYELVDGEITHVTDDPNLEAYITYMADLYARGLLDAEMPAITGADMRSKWTSSNAVMMYNGWTGTETPIGALRELQPDMAYTVLPLLKDENGKVHAEMKTGVGSYCGIPVTSEHPAETIEAINNMIQIDNFTEIVLGVEGTHYNMDAEGNITLIQPAFNDEKNNSNVFVSGFYREDVYPKMWETRLTKNADLQAIFYAFKASLLDGGVPNPTALAPAVTVIDNKSTLETRVGDTLIAVIAGSKDIGALAELREYWNTNGGDKMIAFYNEWLQDK